jgi:hypothetical protein
MFNLFESKKAIIIGLVFIGLVASNVYMRVKNNQLELERDAANAELMIIQTRSDIMQEQLQQVDERNKQAKVKLEKKLKDIKTVNLSDECQENLDFAFNQVRAAAE